MKKSKVKRPLFLPSAISKELQEAISRDFPLGNNVDPLQLYGSHYLPSEVYSWRQTNEFLKKFESSEAEKGRLENECFEGFHDINRRMLEANSYIFPTPLRFHSRKRSLSDVTLCRARNLFREVFGDLSLEEWFIACRHGTGLTVGLDFSQCNIEDKWLYPISVTEEAFPFINLYLRWDLRLSEAIDNYNHNVLGYVGPRFVIVKGSRATTVSKNDTSRRFICIEPTGNMFLQQGLRIIMEHRLRRFGLDISVLQDSHKIIALYQSVVQSLATLDWSKASDSVSIELVKFLAGSPWSHVLLSVRSPFTEISGKWNEINMISSMGNATTFPLETGVFFVLAIAVVSMCRDPSNSQFVTLPNKLDETAADFGVSVYGDDCIIPVGCVDEYVTLLNHLGFILNEEKSFTQNVPFRESCGGDYYAFRDIRPLQLKNPTGNRLSDIEPWLYTIWNLAQKKYITYFGDLTYCYQSLFETLVTLFKELEITIKLVPLFYPDDSGIHVTDWRLIRLIYDNAKLSPLYVSKHGTLSFQYVHFRYSTSIKDRKKRDRFEDSYLRYCDELLTQFRTEHQEYNDIEKRYRRKIRGGYVVAAGISSCSSEISQVIELVTQ
jgi:hypothetical protein